MLARAPCRAIRERGSAAGDAEDQIVPPRHRARVIRGCDRQVEPCSYASSSLARSRGPPPLLSARSRPRRARRRRPSQRECAERGDLPADEQIVAPARPTTGAGSASGSARARECEERAPRPGGAARPTSRASSARRTDSERGEPTARVHGPNAVSRSALVTNSGTRTTRARGQIASPTRSPREPRALRAPVAEGCRYTATTWRSRGRASMP